MEGSGFFDDFYQAFLASSPQVAWKFRHTDMVHQREMLKKSFYHLLSFYGSNNADYYLEQVAISHNREHYNIPPALYDLWLEVLIQTVKKFDRQFSAEIELGWRLVMTPGIVYMKFHYLREPATSSHS